MGVMWAPWRRQQQEQAAELAEVQARLAIFEAAAARVVQATTGYGPYPDIPEPLTRAAACATGTTAVPICTGGRDVTAVIAGPGDPEAWWPAISALTVTTVPPKDSPGLTRITRMTLPDGLLAVAGNRGGASYVWVAEDLDRAARHEAVRYAVKGTRRNWRTGYGPVAALAAVTARWVTRTSKAHAALAAVGVAGLAATAALVVAVPAITRVPPPPAGSSVTGKAHRRKPLRAAGPGQADAESSGPGRRHRAPGTRTVTPSPQPGTQPAASSGPPGPALSLPARISLPPVTVPPVPLPTVTAPIIGPVPLPTISLPPVTLPPVPLPSVSIPPLSAGWPTRRSDSRNSSWAARGRTGKRRSCGGRPGPTGMGATGTATTTARPCG
jgi:hypothetical protein